MKRRNNPLLRRIALPIAAGLIGSVAFAGGTSASAARPESPPTAVVLEWYDRTQATVAAAAFPEQATQGHVWTLSWLAAARAVDHRHDSADSRATAFATALHDTLVDQVPGQQAQLDASLAATLATIPDDRSKARGTAAGHEAAAEVLAERQGDGYDTASINRAFTYPAAAPGVWQPTPPTFGPAVRAGLPDARSFLLRRNDQFRPGPPPSLTSRTYLDSLAEVRSIGAASSTVRSPEQLDVAKFWAQSSIAAYVQVLRGVLADSTAPLEEQTRLVAAFHAVTLDAQIAIHEAKYTYLFWRPVTAIRTGSVDPDPTWTPLIDTPRHPEYPSGHAGYAGAAEVVLESLVGRHTVSVTSTTDPGVTHVFTRWSQITQENVDGRVWEGIHYRFSDEIAVRVGKAVARYDVGRLDRLFGD